VATESTATDRRPDLEVKIVREFPLAFVAVPAVLPLPRQTPPAYALATSDFVLSGLASLHPQLRERASERRFHFDDDQRAEALSCMGIRI